MTDTRSAAVKFAAIIIGDEILSGRRQDKHLSKAIEVLKARGLSLAWARYVGDDRELLVETLRQSFVRGDVVFSFGGIGATPDDHTRQSAAAALGRELVLHPEAEAEIRARFGEETTPQRLRMGEFPQGAAIIPNPYNRIPGFAIQAHYFLPGFPVMAWPMMEWVLDTHYAHLFHQQDHVERAVYVIDALEGLLIDLMESMTARFPQATLFSLPSVGGDGIPRHIELGMKGPAAVVEEAMEVLCAGVTAKGFTWQAEPPRGAA